MGELTGTTFIFFVLFAIVIGAMYIITRRNLAPVGQVALIGTVINVALVALISAGAGNNPLQVIVVALAIGGIFSAASVGIAAYFRGQDVDYAQERQALAESDPGESKAE